MGQYASSCQISWHSVKLLLSYADFTAFNITAVRHFRILYFEMLMADGVSRDNV